VKTCGACGNPRKGKGRKIHVNRKGKLVRVLACSTCFDECLHILCPAPLQLTREHG